MNNDTVTPTVAGTSAAPATKPLGEVIQIDQALVQHHLGEVVAKRYMDMSRLRDLPAATADQPKPA